MFSRSRFLKDVIKFRTLIGPMTLTDYQNLLTEAFLDKTEETPRRGGPSPLSSSFVAFNFL